MRVVALTFHDVVPEGQKYLGSARDAFYRIQAGELERLLSKLRHLGYQTVSSRAFRAWQQGQGTLSERAVILTLDDGYASHFELVAPLLVRYRFTGTFCVAVDQIGQPGHVTWAQLSKLVFLGMEIGAYDRPTKGADDLNGLHRRFLQAKQLLEERLGVSVRALAAPEGHWNGDVAEAARRAGYDAVWASTIGTNGQETNPFGLRRVVVRGGMSVDRIVTMVEGWQPAFWWAGNLQSTIRVTKRLLGVYRYEQLKRRLVPNA